MKYPVLTSFQKSAAMLPRYRRLLCALCLLSLLNCSNYELTLNEKTLYDPQAFRKNLQLEDAHLLACARKVISEQEITSVRQFRQLICGPGEIQSLSGINTFSRLESLGLAANQIRSIESLSALSELRHLNLADNAIIDASALGELNKLVYLNLLGNHGLNCESLQSLKNTRKLELLAPAHCQ